MHKHVADANSSCTECRARGLLRRGVEKDQRERMAYTSLRARFPERFNEDGSLKPGPFPSSRGLNGESRHDVYDEQGNLVSLPTHTQAPRPAIQSQGRMRKPRNTDRDEPLRNDVAGMIADLLPGGQDLHGPVIASVAHQIVVVVRERVLRELESYARENIR